MKVYNKKGLVLLFSLTYMVSYLTRINYSAVISEMGESTGFSKQELSLALTGSFVTYGIGQVLSGFLGDKLRPKGIVLWGLCITTVVNFLLPITTNPLQMAVLWSINGIAQAFIWPPIVTIMVALFRNEEYTKGVVRISFGGSIGTIVVYLVSPLIISFLGWRGVFPISSLSSAMMIILWIIFCPNIKARSKVRMHSGRTPAKKIFTPVLCIALTAMIFQGMLKDGVATWTPSYISENYNMSNESGILSGAVLPVFACISYQASAILYNKRFKNPLYCAGTIFCIGAVSAAILWGLPNNPISSIVLISFLTASMHGVSLIFTSMLPPFYAKSGHVSLISGIINACTYIGSAISAYGIAVLTENFGWNTTLFIWLLIAALGSVVCFTTASPWRKQIEES